MQAQAVAFKRRNIGSRSSRSDRSGSRLRGGRSGGATPSLDALADFVGLAPVAAPGWLEEALTYGRVCRSCGDVGDALRRRATILAAAGDGAASGRVRVLRCISRPTARAARRARRLLPPPAGAAAWQDAHGEGGMRSARIV